MTVVYPRFDQSSAGGLDDLDGLLCIQRRLKFKAPFTQVRTNFCKDEFCTWTACLHGTVQILLQIAVVFTWVRANFETSRVSAMIG